MRTDVILYSMFLEGTGGQLRKMIEDVVPNENTEIYNTIDTLGKRLRRPSYNIAVAVLLFSGREELRDVLSIRHLFDNIKIILILPDRKNETILLGHKLRPRFLSYTDGDFKDVAAVLKKMLTVLDFNNKKLREVN
ncbi:MAG: hypothetical protein V3S72_12015 [Desulfobacterales bacterium]